MCFLITHVFDYFRQSPSLSFSIYPRLLYSPCGCVRLRYIEGICHKIVTKLSRDPNRFHICTDRISELSVIFTLSVSMFFGVQSSIHRIFPGGLSMGLILASCSCVKSFAHIRSMIFALFAFIVIPPINRKKAG